MSGQPSDPDDVTNEQSADVETTTRLPASASSVRGDLSPVSFFAKGFRRLLNGEISVRVAARELVRRRRAISERRREREMLDELRSQPAQFRPEFQSLSATGLLKHFRNRTAPSFLPGFANPDSTSRLQRKLFPEESQRLLETARRIAQEHRWPLLGFGEQDFGDSINWNRDPLSGRLWPLDYHATIPLWHNDGSDIRVLWELNRLGHLITLGRAYALTKDEEFAEESFRQIESWRAQNPLGRGANWACAMEVALRAMNLLTAFSLLRESPALTEERLCELLTLLDQHGRHIKRNLEFSNIATSNHYLSDVVGLLWLGIMLPEFSAAAEWRSWAMAEMLGEMDKQILPDGADYERSTGYHRFVLELFLYSFIICDANDIAIEEKYWQKLRAMFVYLRGILRPDGSAPLIGDTDGGQVIPVVNRNADDHAYLLPFAAAIFAENTLKLPNARPTEELLWALGSDGVNNYQNLTVSTAPVESQAFPDAGTYVLRKGDLYLLFNLGGAAAKGPASHVHNDSLSIEVSAHGRTFLVDPGAYVYTADLGERHVFRSTSYHSTVQIDDDEQNTTNRELPFVIGDEARGRLLKWETGSDYDLISAEHAGYGRFGPQLIHRRTVTFEKTAGWWLVEDEISGSGEHNIAVRFHFDAGLEVEGIGNDKRIAVAWDKIGGEASPRLLVWALDLKMGPHLQGQFTSKQYGSKSPSVSALWSTRGNLPCKLRWAIIPVRPNESVEERLQITNLKSKI